MSSLEKDAFDEGWYLVLSGATMQTASFDKAYKKWEKIGPFYLKAFAEGWEAGVAHLRKNEEKKKQTHIVIKWMPGPVYATLHV